ncbi:DUF167 domain-containing protein [Candidatus Margulisiibacteriota bacterium]
MRKNPNCSINLKLIPKSSENKIIGFLKDGSLKIKLTAPPVDNAANKALIAFLAKQFKLKKHDIQIKSGHTSRKKCIIVQNITKEEIINAVSRLIS